MINQKTQINSKCHSRFSIPNTTKTKTLQVKSITTQDSSFKIASGITLDTKDKPLREKLQPIQPGHEITLKLKF